MKNFILVFLLIALASGPFDVLAQDSEAIAYLKKLSEPVNGLKNETWQYLKAVTRGKSARKVENKRQKLLNELKATKLEVKGAGGFQSDHALRKSFDQYLGLTYTVLNEDFGKILNMEEIAEQSYDAMEAYLLAKEKAHAKLDSASEALQQAERQFATQHGITLIESDTDKVAQKIKEASATLDYYNDVYLIFFKSYKEEAYVLDALQRHDVSALEQHAGTLATFAEQGVDQLKNTGDYQRDNRLRLAAQQMLIFYRQEATEDFPIFVDFFLKKDRFEKLQKVMDAKKKKDMTQQDVDQFNKAANEYNQAVASLNTRSETANQQRTQQLDRWNRSVKAFFDQHAN